MYKIMFGAHVSLAASMQHGYCIRDCSSESGRKSVKAVQFAARAHFDAAKNKARRAFDEYNDVTLMPMRVRGVEATIAFHMNQAEHGRRRQVGLNSVIGLEYLNTLMGLPIGHSVPYCLLSDAERRDVKNMPTGCVDFTPAGFIRRIVVPVRVEAVIVMAHSFRVGMERASRFGAYCSRLMILPKMPRDEVGAQIEADFWGIGLIVDDGNPVLHVAPAPFVQRRHTPAGWRFAEEVYRQATAKDGSL